MNSARGAMQYGMRHAVAASVVFGCVTAFTVVSYFGLLAWSVVAGTPLGGPLALAFMLLLAILVSVAAVLGVLLPVTTLTDLLCERILCWHRLAQIPVATVILVTWTTCLFVLGGLIAQKPTPTAAGLGVCASAILLAPLGVYWWSLQTTGWILNLGARLWQYVWK